MKEIMYLSISNPSTLMYIPKPFQNKNPADAVSFVQTFPFGLLVSQKEFRPIATHLPFVIEEDKKSYTLFSHMAKNNPQGKTIQDQTVLCIFTEPNAYISPELYQKHNNVPTWNYMAVHIYGKLIPMDHEKEKISLLEKMILQFEPTYLKKWENLDSNYKQLTLSELFAFKIEIEAFEFQEKLSQDRNQAEREAIRQNYAQSNKKSERMMAKFMDRKNQQECPFQNNQN